MTNNEFINECKLMNIFLTEEQKYKLEKYKDLLIEWNKKFNLTSITEEKEIYLKHFYDSLCIVKAVNLNEKKNLCDFGTGAGFPGVVLSIVFPKLEIALIESNSKKISFLNIIKENLNLNNITIINDRMENYSKNNKEKFDIITCRAVSNLGIIAELSIMPLKINGLFLPLKANLKEEISKFKNKIEKLGYKIENKIEYILPKENSKRTIPILKKIKTTDKKYPRNYNVIIRDYK